MNARIYHQYRSTYVFVDWSNFSAQDGIDAAQALREIGITEWSRVDFERLRFEADGYLAFGHSANAEKLYGYRFVNVVRPEGMANRGWHNQEEGS